MKRSIVIRETKSQRIERKAIAAINDPKQYRITDSRYASCGVNAR